MPSTAELSILITGKNQASKAFDSAAKSAGGFGKALTDVAKIAGGFAIGAAITQLPKLFDGPIKAASDLGESINAVQVVFGQASDKLLEFGKMSSTQVGLSARAFNQLATPLGAMLKNYGMNADQAAVQTINLTKRAADMASVFNTSVEDALGAVTAALRGETDPIERYGVSVNAAKVETEAMAMTGKKAAAALTDQEKATARLNLIMRQTNAVAGDFVNTSDGLANKQRIQAARSEEVSAALGAKLMPVMLKFKEIQLQVVEGLSEKFIPALQQAINYVTPFAEAIGARLTAGFNTLIAQGPAVVAALQSVVEPVKRLAELFQLGFEGGQIGGQFNVLQTAAFQLGNFFREVLVPAFHDAQNAVHLFFLALQGGSAGGQLTDLQQKALTLGTSVRLMWQQDIKPALIAFADIVVTTVRAINDNWGTIGPILQAGANFAVEAIERVLSKIRAAVTVVSEVVQGIDDLIHGRWSEAWESLKKIGLVMVDEFLADLEAKFSPFIGYAGKLYNVGTNLIQGLWDGMADLWKSVKGWFSSLPDAIPEVFKKVLDLRSPSKVMYEIGENTIEGYINGLLSKYGDLKDTLNSLAMMAPETQMGGGNSALDVFGNLLANATGQRFYEDEIAALMNAMRGVKTEDEDRLFDMALRKLRSSTEDSTSALGQYGAAIKASYDATHNFGSALQSLVPTIQAIGPTWDELITKWGGYSSTPSPIASLPISMGPLGSGGGGGGGGLLGPIDINALGRGGSGGNLGRGGTGNLGRGAPIVVVNVQGSVLSERELAGVIRDQLGGGALRGVFE